MATRSKLNKATQTADAHNTPAPGKRATQASQTASTDEPDPSQALTAELKDAKEKAPKPAKAHKPAPSLSAEKTAKSSKDKAVKTQEKPKKPKLVRDSFTIPKPEYEAIDALKLRGARLGHVPKKSELLRAGLMALAAMNDQAFLSSLQAVPAIKTGRPAN